VRRTIVLDVRGNVDLSRLAEQVRLDEGPMPNGFVIIAEVDDSPISVLRFTSEAIDQYYRAVPTLLIAIEQHEAHLEEASELFDTTLAVAPNKAAGIERLEPHYPNLLREGDQLGTLGSIRTFDVPVTNLTPDDRAIVDALKKVKGETFHPLAETAYPRHYAYCAPGPFANAAERVLGELGRVIDRQTTSRGTLSVTSFVFESDAAEADAEGEGDPSAAGVSVPGQNGRTTEGDDAAESPLAEQVVRRDVSGDADDGDDLDES
jgi:hypothetical protein